MTVSRCVLKIKDQQNPGPVNVVRFSNSGEYFMSGGNDKTVRLYNTRGSIVQEYVGHGWEVSTLDIATDSTVFASSGADKQIFIWDVLAGQSVRKLQGHLQRVNCLAFNEEASILCSGSFDALVKIWDMRSRSYTPIQTLEDSKDSVSSIIVKEHEILTGSIDGSCRIYDLRAGKLRTDSFKNPVTCCSFSGDGNFVLASTLDGTIRLLDKSNGKLLNHFRGHVNTQYRVESCFDYTDAYVISGSEDGTVHIWDVVEGTAIDSLRGHSRSVLSVSYHPKEHYLLTSSSDGYIIVWGK